MPDTFLSTGVSLGVLAGIVSGVCYIVANGLSWPGPKPRKKQCLPSTHDEGVCCKCGGDTRGGLVPCICVYKEPVKFESGAWFLRQVQRAISLMPWSISSDMLEQIDEECEGDSMSSSEGAKVELRNVREFLEALSAKLAGGTLEGTRVAPLFHHPAYESMFERYHDAIRDSLMSLATALQDALKCEDLSHGLYVDDAVTLHALFSTKILFLNCTSRTIF